MASPPPEFARVKVHPKVASDPNHFLARGFFLGPTDDGLKYGVRAMPGYIYMEFPIEEVSIIEDRDPAPGVYGGGKRRGRRSTRRQRNARRRRSTRGRRHH